MVPAGEALEKALELAAAIAANAPMAVRAAKAVATSAVNWTDGDAFALQRRLTDAVRESADATEGARAFVEKRTPVWQDA